MPGLHRQRSAEGMPGQCQEDYTVRILRTRPGPGQRSSYPGPGATGPKPRRRAGTGSPRANAPARHISLVAEAIIVRTYSNLWPRLLSWDNLLLAYHRARRRKRYKRVAVEFDFAWESNLLQLQRELQSGEYAPGVYRHFIIHEPKRRKISAAPFRDRVVHHALVNVLEPIFERRFIFDSYACRRHKGTHRALDRAQGYLRRFPYFLKTDIVKFFPSVDHAVLLELIRRRVADEQVLQLLAKILATGAGVFDDDVPKTYFPDDDLFAVARPRGLPIGNLTSQFCANVLLDPLDHFLKEELRVEGYVRYADDLVLFGRDKVVLWQARDAVSKQLQSLRLRLHGAKTYISSARRGLKFLGFVMYPTDRRLQQSALLRFNRRVKQLRWAYKRRRLTAPQLGVSVRAWLAHAGHANSRGISRVLLRRARF